MTCCPALLWGWGGVGLYHRPCDGGGVELQHRPSDGVGLSYNTNHVTCIPLSVGLGWGEVTTHTM